MLGSVIIGVEIFNFLLKSDEMKERSVRGMKSGFSLEDLSLISKLKGGGGGGSIGDLLIKNLYIKKIININIKIDDPPIPSTNQSLLLSSTGRFWASMIALFTNSSLISLECFIPLKFE